jgi:hypothetical protein
MPDSLNHEDQSGFIIACSILPFPSPVAAFYIGSIEMQNAYEVDERPPKRIKLTHTATESDIEYSNEIEESDDSGEEFNYQDWMVCFNSEDYFYGAETGSYGMPSGDMCEFEFGMRKRDSGETPRLCNICSRCCTGDQLVVTMRPPKCLTGPYSQTPNSGFFLYKIPAQSAAGEPEMVNGTAYLLSEGEGPLQVRFLVLVLIDSY